MPAPLNGRDVDKGVRLSVVAADEAEALHRVEELDGAAGLLAGQLALGAAAVAAATTETAAAAGAAAILTGRALGDRHRLALDLEVGRRDAAAAIHQREFQRLPFGKAGEARLLHGGDVNKHVLAAIVADDEAEALCELKNLTTPLPWPTTWGGMPPPPPPPPRKPPPPPPPKPPPPPPPRNPPPPPP
jgi:hypothetical protein